MPSQRRYEAMRLWPAPEGAPASTGEACTLRNKGMILMALWRARQETEQPIAQANLASQKSARKNENLNARADCTKPKKNEPAQA